MPKSFHRLLGGKLMKINFLFAAVFFALLSASALAATNLGIEPASTAAAQNEQFIIRANISTNDSIAGASLNINFDKNILQALSMAEGGFLSSQGDPLFDLGNSIDNANGRVTFNMGIQTAFKGLNGSGSLVN